MTAFFSGVTKESLNRALPLINASGATFSTSLADIVRHVVNPVTQFRAGPAVALTAFGHSPDDLDLRFFLRLPVPSGWHSARQTSCTAPG